jgi:hypothetical protein
MIVISINLLISETQLSFLGDILVNLNSDWLV